jgi:hypothetical protein
MARQLVSFALLLGFGLGLFACDRKWDFECTAVWTNNGKEVWRKVFTYPQMEHENAATARCKEEMLEARPRGADAAVCECKGIE